VVLRMRHLSQRLRALFTPPSGGSDLVAEAPSVRMRALFRHFWPFARPYRAAIAAGLVVSVVLPAFEAAEIWLFKLVIDDVLVPRDLAPLVWIAGAYLAITLVGGLISFLDDYLAAWVGEHFLLEIRAALFGHLQRLSLDVLDRRRLGDLVTRLTSDVQAIESLVLEGVADGAAAVSRLIFFGGALFLISWKLAAVSLVVVPFFWWAARRFSGVVKRASREKRRRSGSLAAVAEESLANAMLVQSLNRQATEAERFRRENVAIIEAELASTRIRSLFGPLVDVVELAGVVAVIGIGTWLLAAGDLTLGGLLVFLTYLSQLYRPIRSLSKLSQRLFSASAGAERVLELLSEDPRVVDAPDARALAHARGDLELRDVTYTYPGAEQPALRGVSLHVRPGEVVAVVGPSGAGKSTLARLLLRFDDPEHGAVLVDGHDLRTLTVASVRDNVGLLLQETMLPDATVRDVIAYGREGATDADVEAAARAADAHAFIAALPDGYDTRVGQRGRTLSGGQRQRLAVARALIRDTPVLVLDEPTTGLDAAARDRLLGPLGRLMAGRTAILISHDPGVVAHADRVVRVEGGRVVEADPLPARATA